MVHNENMHAAKKNKNDEFYTKMEDIAKELRHYKNHFKDKIVYCNCDDPTASNFSKFFKAKFKSYGLKELITTGYKSLNPDEHTDESGKVSWYRRCIKSDDNDKGYEEKLEIFKTSNGDFRSDECVELLKEADIVVTNPPFSLFREYVAQLVKYDKKFLIIGNQNSISCKHIFPLIKDNKIWLGYGFEGKKEFMVPDHYPLTSKDARIDENNQKFTPVKDATWYTNLEHKKRNGKFIPCESYSPEKYQKFENYDAINVDNADDIPEDYDGEMGVPITFLYKFNPKQFEIVGLGTTAGINFSSKRKMEILDKKGEPTGKYTTNAKGTLYRVFNPKISKKDKKKPPAFKDCQTGVLYSSIYTRMIIKKKKS